MMTDDEKIIAYKLKALRKLASVGLTPSDLGRLVKSAGFGSTIMDLLKNTYLIGLGTAGGLGALGGLATAHITGPTEDDVNEERERQMVDHLIRATDRQKALNSVLESARERDERAKHTRRTALSIQSMF